MTYFRVFVSECSHHQKNVAKAPVIWYADLYDIKTLADVIG